MARKVLGLILPSTRLYYTAGQDEDGLRTRGRGRNVSTSEPSQSHGQDRHPCPTPRSLLRSGRGLNSLSVWAVGRPST
ncbi:hypothetical protein GALMADRAFT_255543 [Galerina marginata CBS 339.88]|uniref:Uncharacterized protein n=1 Tax=Galerina marginata (strain CBS 339.88) TaxID=685588 RepID=A0A067SPX9_GALM3|nr:hypothetical protein GALMADRAFT_255543 [Galerina marginata CBS 339.88]